VPIFFAEEVMSDAPLSQTLLEKLQALAHTLNQLISLERETQRVLKLPAELFLDGVPPAMSGIEREKEGLMQAVDRLSTEVVWLRERLAMLGAIEPSLKAMLEERDLRIRQVLQSLQRLHKESERILKLRLTLLSQDMRQVEQSRQFLRAAMQTVAC
jgi:SMC interacting uncharacterized protein involved in chromosome segregation